jgi:hypothetical protein
MIIIESKDFILSTIYPTTSVIEWSRKAIDLLQDSSSSSTSFKGRATNYSRAGFSMRTIPTWLPLLGLLARAAAIPLSCTAQSSPAATQKIRQLGTAFVQEYPHVSLFIGLVQQRHPIRAS